MRALSIEHVYGDAMKDWPPALVARHVQADDAAFSNQETKANFNALHLRRGYVPSGGVWLMMRKSVRRDWGDDHVTLRLARWSGGGLFLGHKRRTTRIVWALSEVGIGFRKLAQMGIDTETALYAGSTGRGTICAAQRTMPDEGKGLCIFLLRPVIGT